MADVTLLSTPDLHALAKANRTLYRFEGSGRYQTLGVKAVAVLFVSAAVTGATNITLAWGTKKYVLRFTGGSAPTEFSAGTGDSDYVDALVEELNGFYPLREDFVITRYDPTQLPGILFTAKNPGAAYDLSLINPPIGCPFTIGSTLFGANPIIRSQYSIYVEIWLQNLGTDGTDLSAHYSRIYDNYIETDEAGNAQFNVGNILHDRLEADLPAWSFLNPTIGENSARKYYVCYGEAYGFPLQIGKIVNDQLRFIYLGGADYVNRATFGYELNRFKHSGAQNKALRFGSQTRYILPDEPQFLTFLNQSAGGLVMNLVATLTFDDDTTAVFDELYGLQTVPVGRKVCFPVSVGALHLGDKVPPGKLLREYFVKIQVGGQDWSLSYRYILNANYQPYTRFFAYLTSLGVIDTIATYGKGSAELSIFSETAERYLAAHYELSDGQFVEYNVSVQQQVEVATGFWPQKVLQTWTDFYRSPLKLRLTEKGALPIGIVSKSIKEATDGDTLFAHKWTYVYRNKDDFYTGETDDLGDGPVPQNFKMVGGGNLIINQPVVTRNIDDTIPTAVREITQNKIDAWNAAAARPNPLTLGFLTQGSGNALYRRTDQLVPYEQVSNKPTTRDAFGIQDVPTVAELFKLINIKPRIHTWIGPDIPERFD